MTEGYVVSYCWNREWIFAIRARNHDGSWNRREVFYTSNQIQSCLIASPEEAQEFSNCLAIKAAELFCKSEPLPVKIERFVKNKRRRWQKVTDLELIGLS